MEYEINGGVNTITGDVERLEAHGGVLYVKGKVGTLVHHGGVMYDQRPSCPFCIRHCTINDHRTVSNTERTR